MILSWYHKAWDEYLDWQKEDKKILKKINSLIEDTFKKLYPIFLSLVFKSEEKIIEHSKKSQFSKY